MHDDTPKWLIDIERCNSKDIFLGISYVKGDELKDYHGILFGFGFFTVLIYKEYNCF
jgi:hypothetical protein